MNKLLIPLANHFWCVRSVRDSLDRDLDAHDRAISDLLLKIRLLTFAFLSAPIAALIPYAMTRQKEFALASFGIGTVSIVVGLIVFSRIRSIANPIHLVRKGAWATLLVNALLGSLMLFGEVVQLPPETLIRWYLVLQIFSGIPFALINGVDSKLSGSIYRAMNSGEYESFSPNAEFRRLRAAGSTAAAALGALLWSIVLLYRPEATTSAGYYAIIFCFSLVPPLFLLWYLRRLEEQINSHDGLKQALVRQIAAPVVVTKVNPLNEHTSSIIAIGCLEGLLQFSQFYFSLGAIRMLFEEVPNYSILVIAIPLMFYMVNGLEQVGGLLFRVVHDRILVHFSSTVSQLIRVRQWASLATLSFAAILFVLHWLVARGLVWWIGFDVIAFGCFNIVKGFANGLSEQWNEAITIHDRQHDEAGFTTASALFGRLYQILAIVCFFIFNWAWSDGGGFADLNTTQIETKAMIATLTAFVFVLLAANMLAYSWMEQRRKLRPESTWSVIVAAMMNTEERTALFTQLLRVLFVTSLILSNFSANKVISFGAISFSYGALFYVTLFVLINLIAVFESAEAAIKTVFLGMISYVFVVVALLLLGRLPGTITLSPSLITQEGYDYIFGWEIPWLFLVSFAGYIVTILLNIRLLSILGTHFARLPFWGISAAVTLVCQSVDTFIFVWFGFFVGRAENSMDLASMLFGQFSVKCSVYLVMYFPLYILIHLCRKYLRLTPPPPPQPAAAVS